MSNTQTSLKFVYPKMEFGCIDFVLYVSGKKL